MIDDRQFSSHESLQAAVDSSEFRWVPNLLNIIQAPLPLSVRFFKSLPIPTDTKKWAVYAVVLENDGYTPAVYVSSGTDYVQGADRRMRDYEVGSGKPTTVTPCFSKA